MNKCINILIKICIQQNIYLAMLHVGEKYDMCYTQNHYAAADIFILTFPSTYSFLSLIYRTSTHTY